jgi:hypothetical protein
MNFSEALNLCRSGTPIQRTEWNGARMFVCYQEAFPDGIAINAKTSRATKLPEGTVCRFRPYLLLFTQHGDFVPWVASQADLLADDWQAADVTLSYA